MRLNSLQFNWFSVTLKETEEGSKTCACVQVDAATNITTTVSVVAQQTFSGTDALKK